MGGGFPPGSTASSRPSNRELLVHGHHHVWGERVVQLPNVPYETRVVSLSCDGVAGNVWHLDLDALESTL